MKKTIIGLVVVVAAVVLLVTLRPAPQKPREVPAPPPKSGVPLTPELATQLGAASLAPIDVAFFQSSMNLTDLWTGVWKSNAIQSLLQLPMAQRLWKDEIQKAPMYRQMMEVLETDPLFVQGLPVAKDALSSEVFVCAGPELSDFITAYRQVTTKARMNLFWDEESRAVHGRAMADERSGARQTADVVDSVLANQARLRLPSVLIGFKMTDKAAAQKFLDTWVPRIPPLAPARAETGSAPVGKIEKTTIAGSAFYVLELKGDQIPPDAFTSLSRGLEQKDIPQEKIASLTAFIKSQRLVLATGILGEYLMFSIGKDTSLLARWGKGESLAASAALDPLKELRKPGLASIGYCSAGLRRASGWTIADITELANSLVENIPDNESTTELKNRLNKDIGLLAKDVEQDAGEPPLHPFLQVSFRNKGIESYTFGESASLDYSQPLAILAHRGKQPMFCAAGRGLKNPRAYGLFVKWATVAFGYFNDFAVPTMDPKERAQFDKAMKVARPFLTSIDNTTRDFLIPAVDGTQSMILMDGRGEMTKAPDAEPFPTPLSIPRVGFAIELNDAKKFTQAVAQYMKAVRSLFADINKEYSLEHPLSLPDPQTTEIAGTKLYFYPLPVALGNDVLPCALLKDRLLILASSPGLAGEMVETAAMPDCPVTRTAEPAGAVTLFDGAECWGMFKRLTGFVFALQAHDMRERDREQVMLIQMHIDALWRSLGAIRGYHSTKTLVNGRVVSHSWLHVEDISP